MNGKFKKTACMILALIISFSIAVPALAVDNCSCGYNPIVYVAALGSAKLCLDKGTENERIIFRPEKETTLKLIGDILPDAARFAIDKNYEAFGNGIIEALYKVYGPLAMNENGNSSDRVTAITSLPDNPEHGIDQSYYFAYDFRSDPFEIADRLNEFIQHVKALTGHDKVMLRASSMGGVITMAYFKRYGTEDVTACIFQCCPILGTAVAGELLTKQLKLDKKALIRYASQALDDDLTGIMLKSLIEVLDFTGFFDSLIDLGDDLILHLTDKFYDEFLIPVLGSMPGIWGFVPDEYYEQAKAVSLIGKDSPALIEKLDNYHYNVQCKADEILRSAVDSGVRIMIVAGYNMQRTPLVVSNKNDSKYASVGATVAHLHKTLGAGYIQARDCGHSHISQDGRIDASTCVLPENTWFIKNMLHSTIHDGMKELYNWFFYTDEYYDVFSSEQYPQFLLNDKANQALIPMKSVSSLPGGIDEGNKKDSDISITIKNIPEQNNAKPCIGEQQENIPKTGAYFNGIYVYITASVAVLIFGAAVYVRRREKNNVYPD
jgi:pimeloyl-ACP methyl ester carboxylesterase